MMFMSVPTQATDTNSRSIAVYEESVSDGLRSFRNSINAARLSRGTRPGVLTRKRVIDLVGAGGLLLLMLPLLLLMLAAVTVAGGRPIYGHLRVGRGGRMFRCWKIRTMVPDAEARLAGLLRADPALADEWARDHKLRHDPRVTRLGHLLRLTSFDELPQLWNIVRGEMSLVGPRPVTRAELARYGGSARHYLAVRPGLTGMWQLDGRNDMPYARRVVLDRFYATRPSLWRDVTLLARTPLALLRRPGR